jgi:hypothetical protein
MIATACCPAERNQTLPPTSCQSGEDCQPRQNVECPYPAADSQRKKEIERHRCNNSVDRPEEPKPKLHDVDPTETVQPPLAGASLAFTSSFIIH